jgi:hypothetical protein
MDERLTKALDFAKFRETLSIQRKTLKEKIDARLTFGHNGGIFKIDQSLISFVETLISRGRVSEIPLVDVNENPVLINDLNAFQEELLDRYFTATLEYFQEYEKIKKSRTVERLLDL